LGIQVVKWAYARTIGEKMAKLIAIVEDEPDIAELISLHLQKAGFEVAAFPNAQSFLSFIHERVPNLLILDLMLPDIDGFEVCKLLKRSAEFASIPVIMLTARSEEIDRILGLELGADDYVTKPFSPRELVARVKAVLRRQERAVAEKKIAIGDILVINLAKYEVTVAREKVELTTTEFRILQLLSSKPGWVFTRDQILEHLWGHDKIVVDRTVDVHIRNLRVKLGKAAGFVKNVRGIGYRLER
jgi:two-component system phosphate regulon response regulator PhoB/two-component system alkaline phosphatase synthesis response regulator PhoP